MTAQTVRESIGVPYGNGEGEAAVLEQGIADAHAVTEQDSGKSYMRGFTDHFRAKSMTPADIRSIENERLEAGIGMDGGSETSNGGKSRNCCLRDVGLSRLGMGGPNLNTAVYRCTEVCDGECKWRTCAEPTTACVYRFDHRITVRDSHDIHAVPKSILIHACTRQEAHDEADVEYESIKM